jgi:hypothetical protein
MIRPTPSQPSGNVEKSFCSLCLLGQTENALDEISPIDAELNP